MLVIAVNAGVTTLAGTGTNTPQVVVITVVGVGRHRTGFAVVGLDIQTRPFVVANRHRQREGDRIVFAPFVIGTVSGKVGGDTVDVANAEGAPHRHAVTILATLIPVVLVRPGQEDGRRLPCFASPEGFIPGDGIELFFTPDVVVSLIAFIEILRHCAEVFLREAVARKGNRAVVFVEGFRVAQLVRGSFQPVAVWLTAPRLGGVNGNSAKRIEIAPDTQRRRGVLFT